MNDSQFDQDKKRLSRILRHRNGMAALEQVLAEDGGNAKVQNEWEGKPIVPILVPSYRAPNPRMIAKTRDMCRYTEEKGIARTVGMPLMRNSVVHWQRNDLLCKLIESKAPFTHVLFIDDDIVPEPDHLAKLLSHNVDIIAGLCTFRQDPPVPNARYYDPKSQRYAEMLEWSREGLVRVDAVGTGMMLISRNALQKTADVWLDCKIERDVYGISEEKADEWSKMRTETFDGSPNAFWFQFLPTPDGGVREFGEDISFCYKAQKYAGLQIWVDTTVTPEHIGEYGYTIGDYKSQRSIHKQRMATEGRMLLNADSRLLENSKPAKISLLLPTRGRPENIKRLLDSLKETSATMPEVVLYVDDDDETVAQIPEGTVIVRGPRRTLSECWNEAYKVATGEILMHAGDDIVFKTKNWDVMVSNAFEAVPDRLIFAHGDDGHFGKQFGTHGFIHRKWAETVGYFVPPYFSSDYNDTWLNDVANALVRRVYLPLETEHMHPMFGKGEWDKTHKERLVRHEKDGVEQIYAAKANERAADVAKLRAVIDAPKTT